MTTTQQNFPKIYLYRRIVQAKMFIDANYYQPLNLDDIADEAYFSKYHFIRLFKLTYGKTPYQYLTAVRIENARLLLKKGNSVSEVCYAVGFDSVTSFSALFKKFTGGPPSAYRKNEMDRNLTMISSPELFIPNCFALEMGWKNSNFQ